MLVEDTALPEVKILTPRRIKDARGFFAETWNARDFAAASIATAFVQDNHSLSRQAGTIRGLHFQAPPHAQAKLVRCGRGRLYDVAVDIRQGSPRFGQWVGVELSAGNGRQLLIPEGFLHGFVTREPDTEVVYKCSAYYEPAADGAVRFDDPAIGIDWGIDPAQAIVSDKDAAAPLLADLGTPFTYEAAP
ncbi:MAG: dTDP-4-dehydrorhamnose 3,5-epimerase [Paracoccaceae bacterium]|nr:dTDP-4-dehydrorhamnose 3,5-epimerase [Paracoccaceae bacterium]